MHIGGRIVLGALALHLKSVFNTFSMRRLKPQPSKSNDNQYKYWPERHFEFVYPYCFSGGGVLPFRVSRPSARGPQLYTQRLLLEHAPPPVGRPRRGAGPRASGRFPRVPPPRAPRAPSCRLSAVLDAH